MGPEERQGPELDPQQVEYELHSRALLKKGLCPDSGLRLHPDGEGPVGRLSCDMCDCFGYNPEGVDIP